MGIARICMTSPLNGNHLSIQCESALRTARIVSFNGKVIDINHTRILAHFTSHINHQFDTTLLHNKSISKHVEARKIFRLDLMLVFQIHQQE